MLTAKVEMLVPDRKQGRPKLQLVPLVCGELCLNAVLDTGSEMTVIRESLLPHRSSEPSGTDKLISAFRNAVEANLASCPWG